MGSFESTGGTELFLDFFVFLRPFAKEKQIKRVSLWSTDHSLQVSVFETDRN